MTAGHASAEVHVEDWGDLRRLPRVMDEVGDQVDRIVEHATTWVANPAGFEPSPVCLLRPLADAMGPLARAFADLGREFGEQWAQVREGVVVAERELTASDARAVEGSLALGRALSGVA
jgi:hypothetical protein